MYTIFFLAAQVLVAPLPAPSATIDLVRPPKGVAMKEYREQRMRALRSKTILAHMLSKKVGVGEGVTHLQIVKEQKDASAWIEKHLHTEPIGKTSIRVSFSAGSAKDQVVIINAAIKDYLILGPPSRRGLLLSRLEKGRLARPDLVKFIADAEARLAKLKQKKPKTKLEAEAIDGQLETQIKLVTRLKSNLKAFDAGQKEMRAELDNLAPHPVGQVAQEPGSRPYAGLDALFLHSSAKHQEKPDASPESRKKNGIKDQ